MHKGLYDWICYPIVFRSVHFIHGECSPRETREREGRRKWKFNLFKVNKLMLLTWLRCHIVNNILEWGIWPQFHGKMGINFSGSLKTLFLTLITQIVVKSASYSYSSRWDLSIGAWCLRKKNLVKKS